MKLQSLFAAGSLALGVLAFGAAQAAPPVTVPVAVSPAAPAATIPPARLALAGQVFEAMGGQTAVERLLHGAMGEIPMVTAKAPAKDQAKLADIVQFVSARLAYYHPQIVQSVEAIYASEFTDEELHAILAFYETPAGRALAEKSPRIDALSLVAVMPILKRLMGDVKAHSAAMKSAAPPARPPAASPPRPSPPKP
ncbi:MAG: DUF2059 domain-containing protein [Caulobacteraceae bacterium]